MVIFRCGPASLGDAGNQVLSAAAGQKFAGTAHACRMVRDEIGGFFVDKSHVEGARAGTIWYARLMGKPTSSLAEFQPPAEREAFEKEWRSLLDGYVNWARGLGDSDWDRCPPAKSSAHN